MSKQFWLVLGAIIVVLGAILFVTNHNNPSSTGASGTPTSHTEGTSAAGVKLVEYGDFQCPVCGTFYQVVKQVADKYNNSVVFQFRNLPLTSIHPNAFAAARAAEAAGLQNKYWEMHDLLYTNQSTWANSTDPLQLFDSYAQQLGLNVTKFNTDYASDAVNRAINADLNAFAQTGDEMATPTFYLDGTKLDNLSLADSTGTPNIDAFSKIIDAELAKKSSATKP